MDTVIYSNGTMDGEEINKSGVGSPINVIKPRFVKEFYHDVEADIYYHSTGLTSADWVVISGGGVASGIVFEDITLGNVTISTSSLIDSVSAPNLESITIFSIDNCPLISELSFPALTTSAGHLSFFTLNGLTSINLLLLNFVDGKLDFDGNPLITEYNFPSLVTLNYGIDFDTCVLLTSVALPVFLPTNGTHLDFSGCALSKTSVDHILSRCVASAEFVSGTVDLSGGTNSPPTSVDEGSDYDILTQRGVIVTINL